MLIQFKVKNFKSFKDETIMSKVASNYDKSIINENLIFNKNFNLKLLKSAVIYGANASGKTKLFDAFNFMRHFVLNSNEYNNKNIPIDPFRLDLKSENKPSEFEIIFLKNNKMYRYGFELDKEKVISEWLYYKPKSKEVEIFYRENENYDFHKVLYRKGKRVYDEKLVNKNALLLTVANKFNDEISKDVTEWFERLMFINNFTEERYSHKTIDLILDDDYKEKIINLMKVADFSINEINVEKKEYLELPIEILELLKKKNIENKKFIGIDIKSKHKVYDDNKNFVKSIDFSMFNDESSGTLKFFNISGTILYALNNGLVMFIDELDSKLHPNLVNEIIKLFNSKEINKKNAQLIFNTHNTNLLSLDLFRRDQIWFTEKNKYGESKLFSLADFKSDKVRKTHNFEHAYLKGKYGGVPFLGSFNEFEKNNL